MLALHEDPNYEDLQTCHLYTALEAAMQIQKKKVIVGPADSVGIMLFNTVRSLSYTRVVKAGQLIVNGFWGVHQTRKADQKQKKGSEIKQNNYVYQQITPISAPKIQELMQLLEGTLLNPLICDGR
jgi:ATP-dependent DNA helicase 2 subunit 1